MKMEEEHKQEIIREELNIARDEAYNQWVVDNLDDLKEEFIDYSPDEFNDFCLGEYESSGGND